MRVQLKNPQTQSLKHRFMFPSLFMGRFCSQVLALITLLLLLDNSDVCLCKNSTSICIEQEREVLLQLRQSLLDPLHLLSSWKGEDCCRWRGVTCDEVYGHVIELQFIPQTVRGENGTVVIPIEEKLSIAGKLNSSLLNNGTVVIPVENKLSIAGKLNSSLVNLRYLNYLDLSGIDFKHGGIPVFLGSMKQLRYLNLSFGNFYGAVPQQLGNLTELEVLDLRDHNGNLFVNDIQWVSYLRSLNYLDMSGLNFTGYGDLMQVINMLPSLSHLGLSACGLGNFHLSSIFLANSTSLVHLQYLDLSTNFLEGPIAKAMFHNMTSLQYLDLSRNSFNSSIPMWFDKLTSLVHLNLEGNLFLGIEGGLFSFLKCKKYLKSLRLCGNQIREEISTSQRNSSRFTENNLESLVVCNNYLSGALPNWLVNYTLLRYLDLRSNFFSGPIPRVMGELSNLVTIDLSHNQLYGTIPLLLGQLSSLRSLDLSYNQFSGHIPQSLGQLRALQDLSLNSNHLNGTIPVVLESFPICRFCIFLTIL
ncbi:hypothetical protein BT93_D0014 [Corymbia citriodora subsp. variegata]|nr:hypothetical protein BT93_D0014 [Corymbia citriodora subsp. variegata]